MMEFSRFIRIEFSRGLFSKAGLFGIIITLIFPVVMIASQFTSIKTTSIMLSTFSMGALYSIVGRIQFKVSQRNAIDANRAAFILYSKYIITTSRLIVEMCVFLVVEIFTFILACGLLLLNSNADAINILQIAKELPLILIATTFLYLLGSILAYLAIAKTKNDNLAKLFSSLISLFIVIPSIVSTFLVMFLPDFQLWIINNIFLVSFTPVFNIIIPGIISVMGSQAYYSIFSSIEYIIIILVIFKYYTNAEKGYLITI